MKNSIFLLVLVLISYTTNTYSQWVQVNNGLGNVTVRSIDAKGDTLFAAVYNNPNGGVFRSGNNGADWIRTSLISIYVLSLTVEGNNVYAGIDGSGVYITPDNGTNWTQSLSNRNVYALIADSNNIYAGVGGIADGVHWSSNNGQIWVFSSFLSSHYVISLTSNGNFVFAGSWAFPHPGNNPKGVYISANNGLNWTQTSLNNRNIHSLYSVGNYIFAGSGKNGVYFTDNNGSNWVQTQLNYSTVYALTSAGNHLFAGTDSNGVYVSTNNGNVWNQWNDGLGDQTVRSLCVFNNYIFAGINSGGVYRRPLSELTRIEQITSEIPSTFSLSQNYPNPFNPSTHFKFRIAEFGPVQLKIFDVLGREITTLLNEQLQPGTYETVWDASIYPSGVYYYKLEAGSFTETKKMILLK